MKSVSKDITVIIERDKEEEKSAREKIIIIDKVSIPESFKTLKSSSKN